MPIVYRTLPLFAWICAILLGFGQLWNYESTPGQAALAGALAPNPQQRNGSIVLDQTLPTIVLFAHPDCPCTRASLDGLADLASAHPGRTRIVVAIVGKGGSGNEAAARAIPGAVVLTDPQGREAARLGATTSGQTFAFSPDGRTLFSGGLTEMRGHYGSSAGLDALGDVLQGERPKVATTPVFGCALEVRREAR